MSKMAATEPLTPLIIPTAVPWPEATVPNSHTKLQADAYKLSFENTQGHIHIHQLLAEKDLVIADLTAQIANLAIALPVIFTMKPLCLVKKRTDMYIHNRLF
jgi:hypothetical protein